MSDGTSIIAWFESLGRADGARVGGKNASLGELTARLVPMGIRVPQGFATTADAYWAFVGSAGIEPAIGDALAAYRSGKASLDVTGTAIRRALLDAPFPQALARPIAAAYHELSRRAGKTDVAVAVRSSATAEDLPDAS